MYFVVGILVEISRIFSWSCRRWQTDNSRKLEDRLVTNIDQNRLVDIRYRVKSCYATYKKKGARHKVETPRRKPEEPDLAEPDLPDQRDPKQ